MKRLIKMTLILSMAAVLLAACAAAPATTPKSEVNRQINVSGVGQLYLKPDVAYVYIGITSRAPNVSEALQDNSGKAQAISSTLTGLGVEAKDIQTSAFNVYPQQQFGPSGEVIGNEYVVENTVFVTVHDLQNLGKMLDAAISSGANTIHGIQFDVSDKASALTKARQMAIEDARKNAQELASAAGVELGELITLNVYGVNPPVPVFEGKGGAMATSGQVPVSAGQLVLTVNADLSFQIR